MRLKVYVDDLMGYSKLQIISFVFKCLALLEREIQLFVINNLIEIISEQSKQEFLTGREWR